MTHRRPRWITSTAVGAAITIMIAAMLVPPRTALGYERYNDGCNNCHGAFDGPTSPQGTIFPSGDKHTMHRSSSSMNTECDLCHLTGDNWDPFIGESNGTAFNPPVGCNGCHGRDYGGAIGNSGVGLRAHHELNGVTCVTCHPGDPIPLPENIKPTYYGTPDTNVDDSCNAGPGYLENWSIGDTQGQDNDGDNLYDGLDPDCCPADVDHDGDVDLSDLATQLASYGVTSGASYDDGDLDGDGDVDLADLATLLAVYGSICI